MLDNIQTALQAAMNAEQAVTVYLNQLTDGSSTGRSGAVIRVGQDYFTLLEEGGRKAYLIPFNAITLMEAAPGQSPIGH